MLRSKTTKGLEFPRRFTRSGVSPFDMFTYDYRTSIIRNPSGEVVFEMKNVEVPAQWSQIATGHHCSKVFPKGGRTTGRWKRWKGNFSKTGSSSYGQLLESLGRTL
jgi:hypothetical protein